MCAQNEAYLVKHIRIRCKTYKVWLKIVQTALKWPLQYVNFQKFSREKCPQTPLEPFLFLDFLQINSAEKNTLKSFKLWCPLPEKISEYALT